MEFRRIEYRDGGWCEQQYVDGRLNGLWTVYFPNGRKKWERQHLNERKEGHYREWDADGRLREEQFYHHDELHGPWRRWDADGREELVGEFAFGRPAKDRTKQPASRLWGQLLPYWEFEPAQFRGRVNELERTLARPTWRFKPDEDRAFEDVFGASYFGHVNARLGAGEEWPEADGVPFIPILQLDCTCLPLRASELAGVRLLTAFARPDEVTDSGADVVIRAYTTADELRPATGPRGPGQARFVTFLPPEPSFPDHNDLPPGLKVYLEDEQPASPLWNGPDWSLNSRVGGWPGWIQFTRLEGLGEFVFQLDSIDVDGWECGDSTVFYFFSGAGGWSWLQEMC